MGLVDYYDSDDEESCQTSTHDASPPSKRRKTTSSTEEKHALPPLPAAFRDLYSSTVRTSTHDDPSLHGGRKRVTPHVAGNWPAHVYLEWNPSAQDADVLREIVKSAQASAATAAHTDGSLSVVVHSLLQNDLGVALPLHVSLSRPLTLPTSEKDLFVERLISSIRSSHIHKFTVHPLNTAWHSNEDQSRWFLVLRLRRPTYDELRKLLEVSNRKAREFQQPLLYQKASTAAHAAKPSPMQPKEEGEGEEEAHDSFHISLAWSLSPPKPLGSTFSEALEIEHATLRALSIEFSQVKIRVGQDVTSCPLATQRAIRKHE